MNLIYPQVCGVCGKINEKSLCNKCKIRLIEEFSFKIEDYTRDTTKYFVKHYYFFRYKNLIRNQILELKFHDKPYISKTITYFLKNVQKSFEKLKNYDIIIIVPISRERKKERGYNQSELISKEISLMLNIPIMKNILYKNKNTVPQSTLNKEQREQNAKGVYNVKNCYKIQNKKILLIDDIYTTGSTVNECAKVLVQNGINRNQIGVLTIAKD